MARRTTWMAGYRRFHQGTGGRTFVDFRP
uniref:Uncharacterized protein n=1 Tax=Arundo donax TaxID=35708 RepID=A0A0A8YU84_ARUDO